MTSCGRCGSIDEDDILRPLRYALLRYALLRYALLRYALFVADSSQTPISQFVILEGWGRRCYQPRFL